MGALVYSAVPIPFLKAFYSIIAFIQGVSWWEAPWPLPGAILAGLSLACNSVAIYFTVVLIQGIRRRKRRDPQSP